jgi:antitoxin HicB
MRAEFPDVPEANTFGEDAGEALMHAVDPRESALCIYVEDRRNTPKPPPVKPRGKAVILPALTEAKLSRRLNWHLPQVGRLLDLLHASRLDQLEAAFRVLGKRLSVEIREAA